MSNDDQQISRRDWFRLRVAQPGRDRLGAEPHTGMQPVAEPPNHDGLDPAELPPVHEAFISPEEARALFSDLRRHASDVQLLARGAAASEGQLSQYLRRTCERLIAGELTKVQVRYEWQDARWIDTLEHKPGGIRLVRIKHGR